MNAQLSTQKYPLLTFYRFIRYLIDEWNFIYSYMFNTFVY